mmetsp:Transcript_20089/g.55936  ORF Transcript_20089/g.55936 Transcript_20089/m.55936 type:complete len:90 (-) Transcript_20089:1027-1296(-)
MLSSSGNKLAGTPYVINSLLHSRGDPKCNLNRIRNALGKAFNTADKTGLIRVLEKHICIPAGRIGVASIMLNLTAASALLKWARSVPIV